MKITLSTPAVNDLQDIYRYGLVTFSRATADSYLDLILSAFRTIEHNPRIGRLVPLTKTALHRYVVNKHIIYYDLFDTRIKIIRILHHTQDHPAHLPD